MRLSSDLSWAKLYEICILKIRKEPWMLLKVCMRIFVSIHELSSTGHFIKPPNYCEHEPHETRQITDHAGYVLAIDMTARNVQDEAKKKGLPWSIAKGFDTFLPISNFIAKHRIPDPQKAHLWLSVNNEMKQSDNTELMLFRIPRQLSDISRVMTLEKGDIVLTGTPKGVGPVKTGDIMRAGLKVDGKDIEEASLEVPVADREGLYEFRET
jgi:acylpyruvate hydrolase